MEQQTEHGGPKIHICLVGRPQWNRWTALAGDS